MICINNLFIYVSNIISNIKQNSRRQVLMQSRSEISSAYVALLDQLRYLLARDNLCNNTYLYKHITPQLTLPLYAIAEQRRISAITNNEQDIANALFQSGYARVNNREVAIVEYPTIKLSVRDQKILNEIERMLKEKEISHSYSERLEKQFINLTIYSEDINFLENLIVSASTEAHFERANLYEDIKAGTNRIRKIKQQHKNGSTTKNTKYSINKPPQIFIRWAVQSQDEEDVDEIKRNRHQKKPKYREASKKDVSVKFNSDDFPSLS